MTSSNNDCCNTKRDVNLNTIDEAIRSFSKEVHLNVYRKMRLLREMEQHMVREKNLGHIPSSLYLSTGQEAVAAAISEVIKCCQIFAQHRSDDVYLSFGGDARCLRDELLGLKSGCSRGKGGQIGIQFRNSNIEMYGDNLLIGECVPRAVGAALANNKLTLCFFGDGAAEEDYVLESLGFAATHKLPIVFVCMDNDLAILTQIKERRNWSIVDVAKGFGMDAYDLADDPWTIMSILSGVEQHNPILMNIRVCREFWHVGTGIDGPREWDRDVIVRAQLESLGYGEILNDIDHKIKLEMNEVWKHEVI